MSRPPVRDSEKLKQFLADEARDIYYVDMLLERTKAAGQGKVVQSASGNAYNVTFARERVVIEHHYLRDWKPLYVPHDDFIVALLHQRARLTQPG